MNDWRSGAWRPAVFSERRHFVPIDSPTRPFGRCTLATGLCGFPGYLEDDVRGGDWTRWRLCDQCLPHWLDPWPPPGYLPSGSITGSFPELGVLVDWWWRACGPGGAPPMHGYRLHETGLDSLRVDSRELADLQRLDYRGRVRQSVSGTLDYVVSLLDPSWPSG